MQVFKWLGEDRMPCHGGSGQWPEAGKWRSVYWRRNLEPCTVGLHLCRRQDLAGWIGARLWLAEYAGECIEETDKIVVRKARLIRELPWTNETRVRFAIACAERVLHLFENEFPDNKAPRRALEAVKTGIFGDDDISASANAARMAAEIAGTKYAIDPINGYIARIAHAAALAAYAVNATVNTANIAYTTTSYAAATQTAQNASFAMENALGHAARLNETRVQSEILAEMMGV